MTVPRPTSLYSKIPLGVPGVILLFDLLNTFVASAVLPVPKGPGGQTCKSSVTTTNRAVLSRGVDGAQSDVAPTVEQPSPFDPAEGNIP